MLRKNLLLIYIISPHKTVPSPKANTFRIYSQYNFSDNLPYEEVLNRNSVN